MNRAHLVFRIGFITLLVFAICTQGDDTFNSLVSTGKFREALDYADEKIPSANRDDVIWVKIADANDALGLNEKALACYLVAWRLNAKSYASLSGIAKIYNKLNQPDNAVTWAQKALEINFTAEASWEYARACIALNRAPEAKSALEKVIQSDPSNDIANRELGKIYFNEKNWQQALPLLKKSYVKKSDPDVTYQIGKASLETGAVDTAVLYLFKAVSEGRADAAAIDLARAYFKIKKYDQTIVTFAKVSSAQLTAEDLYKIAVSKEAAKGVDASQDYELAVTKFGQSKSEEALNARVKTGQYLLKNAKYSDAIAQFRFVTETDSSGKIIPEGSVLLSDAMRGSGDLKNAISVLERAITLDNKNVEAYVRLGDCYTLYKMPDRANATWEKLLKLSPNDPSIYLKLGIYNLKIEKYSDALVNFEKSLTIKKSADALAGVALASVRLKNNDKAIDAGRQAVDIDAKNRDARLVLADIYYNNKDYRNAESHLEFLATIEPSNIENIERLATCYENNASMAKLYDLDRKIIDLNSKNVQSRMRLAKRADSLKLLDSAVFYYSQLAILTPTEPFVFNRLFKLSIKAGKRNDVVTYFGKYIGLKQDDAEAYRDYGDFLYEQKDYDNALESYRKALAINPTIKGFHKRYAEIVIAKGQEDEVITALSSVIKNGEAELGTYTTLGMIYQKKKVFAKAIEIYQKALQLEPVNTDVLTSLASCQALNSDYKSAVISYEQALMVNAQLVDEYKEIGDIYLKLSRRDEAVKAYTKYFEKNASDFTIAKFLGENAFERKLYQEAIKYLEVLGSQAEARYLTMYAEALLAVEKFDAAVVPLEKLKLDRKQIDNTLLQKVLSLLALSYEKTGKVKDAASVYDEYLALPNVKDPDVAFKRALLIESSDTVAALKIFEANTKTYPADYRNFLRAGLLYANKAATLEKSVIMLTRVTELASSVPEVWIELGRAYGKLNRNDEELRAYKRFAETNPQSTEANSRIGILLMRKGLTNEGMVYLELANTLKPNETQIMALLAEGYIKTNRVTEAVDLLEKAKKQKPDDPSIHFQLFELYWTLKDNEKALSEIKTLIEMKRETEYLVKYADFLSETNKQKEALEILEEVLGAEPDNFDVLMLKAKFLRKEKKLDEAIEIYKAISGMIPDHLPSMFERAETHLEQSKPQWAETFYLRVLRIDPEFALAELGLAKIAKLRKDEVQYKARLEKAKALDPTNKIILDEISSSTK